MRVSDADPAMLRYLAERGIVPGVSLTLTDRQPFGGPLTVRLGAATSTRSAASSPPPCASPPSGSTTAPTRSPG